MHGVASRIARSLYLDHLVFYFDSLLALLHCDSPYACVIRLGTTPPSFCQTVFDEELGAHDSH
jgi:hypothetical protein